MFWDFGQPKRCVSQKNMLNPKVFASSNFLIPKKNLHPQKSFCVPKNPSPQSRPNLHKRDTVHSLNVRIKHTTRACTSLVVTSFTSVPAIHRCWVPSHLTLRATNIDPSRICPPKPMTLGILLLLPCKRDPDTLPDTPGHVWTEASLHFFPCGSRGTDTFPLSTDPFSFLKLWADRKPCTTGSSTALLSTVHRTSRRVFSCPPETVGHSPNSATLGIEQHTSQLPGLSPTTRDLARTLPTRLTILRASGTLRTLNLQS